RQHRLSRPLGNVGAPRTPGRLSSRSSGRDRACPPSPRRRTASSGKLVVYMPTITRAPVQRQQFDPGTTTTVDADDAVFFQGDGERQSPAATIRLLAEYEAAHGVAPDSYSLGGTVAELEEVMARYLGKAAALFVPTGTLANHLAIRKHCGTRGQALVPEQSHIYRDTGDA